MYWNIESNTVPSEKKFKALCSTTTLSLSFFPGNINFVSPVLLKIVVGGCIEQQQIRKKKVWNDRWIESGRTGVLKVGSGDRSRT